MNISELLSRASIALIEGAEVDARDSTLLYRAFSGEHLALADKALVISLARAIVGGSYLPCTRLCLKTQKLGMTGSTSGYVHYRGIHVEHFSYSDRDAEAQALQTLEQECEKVLEKGFMLTARTAICPLHREASDNSKWPIAMMMFYCFFEKDGKVAAIFNRHGTEGMVSCTQGEDGQSSLQGIVEDAYAVFHRFQNAGWKAVIPRSYAHFIELMTKLNIPDEAIAHEIGYEVSIS